jgi:hypothetical protein
MRLEFHQLERRLEHLRVRRPERHRRLPASLAASRRRSWWLEPSSLTVIW